MSEKLNQAIPQWKWDLIKPALLFHITAEDAEHFHSLMYGTEVSLTPLTLFNTKKLSTVVYQRSVKPITEQYFISGFTQCPQATESDFNSFEKGDFMEVGN